jgi:hypothetical protein
MTHPLVADVLLCVYALLMACLEIEIEAAHGWAERLPTWYRTSGAQARVFAVLSSGKPLTGYHFFLLPLTLLSFHLPFVFGSPWNAARELAVMAAWVSWLAAWDLLWFVLNPAYGWRRFRRERVWWHRVWIGRVPLDYILALVASLSVAAAADRLPGGRTVFRDQVLLLGAFAVLTLLATALAPAYRRWYTRMHRPEFDQRLDAGVQPPPEPPLE